MRRERSARPSRSRRCVCLRERVRPSVCTYTREDVLVYTFVRVCSCVLLCVCLYECAEGSVCVWRSGEVPVRVCVPARVCPSDVKACSCARPEVPIRMRVYL